MSTDLTNKDALSLIEQAINLGQSKGVYNLEDSFYIKLALDKIKNNYEDQLKTENIETVAEIITAEIITGE